MTRLVQLAALLVSVGALPGADRDAGPGPELMEVNVSSSLTGNNATSHDHYRPAALPPSLPNLEIIPFVAADAVHEDVQPPESLESPDLALLPADDRFTPPANTEGGFVPKSPNESIVSEVSEVYDTTVTEPPPPPPSPPDSGFSSGGILQMLLGGSDVPPAATTTSTASSTPGLLPALGGCNIYGRTYSLQQPVPELSSACRACSCTWQGLTCRAAPDCPPVQPDSTVIA